VTICNIAFRTRYSVLCTFPSNSARSSVVKIIGVASGIFFAAHAALEKSRVIMGYEAIHGLGTR